MECSKCQIKMFEFIRRVEPRLLQTIWFCPRCDTEIEGNTFAGDMEVEIEWFVYLKLPNNLNVDQIKAIRKVDVNLGSKTVLEFKNYLRSLKSIYVGPYWPKDKAESAMNVLKNEGLVCNMTVGKNA